MWQCGNGRWHAQPDDGLPWEACEWGLMSYYDARVAHEAARRIRYRIPQAWEWFAIGASGLVVFLEVVRLVVGDDGLLALFGWGR